MKQKVFLIIFCSILLIGLKHQIFQITGLPKVQAAIGGPINIEGPLNIRGASGVFTAVRFSDAVNSAYFVEPAATGNSLILKGTVGIGTSDPGAKLDVYGSIKAKDGFCIGASCVTDWGAVGGYWNRTGTLLKPTTVTDNVTTLGSVGVGTTNPVSKLDINGSLNIDNGNTNQGISLGLSGYQANITWNAGTGNLDISPRSGYLVKFASSQDIYGNYILLGSDSYATTRTNNTVKLSRILMPPYATASLSFSQLNGATTDTDNIVTFGGGASGYAAATRVSFWTGATNNTDTGIERLTILSNGNVGVGMTLPTYKLDVQGGQVNSSGGYCIAGDCKASWAAVGGYWNRTGTLLKPTTVTDNVTTLGSVGIGTTTPTDALEVWVGATQEFGVESGQVYGGRFAETGNTKYYIDPGAAISLAIAGNAGIGVTSPGAYLHVNGNAIIGYGDGVTPASLANGLAVSGNVGIGTTAPLSKLSVGSAGSANAAIYGYNSGLYGIYGQGATYGFYGLSTAGTAVYGVGGDAGVKGSGTAYGVYGTGTSIGGYFTSDGYALITGTGNVGIGLTTPTYGLEVAGTSRIDGDFTIGDASADSLTVNAAAATFANDTNVTLSGGTNGFQFDTPTFSVDATNHRIGIGTTSPGYGLEVAGTSRIDGNFTIGDASTDTVTVNAAAITFAYDTNVTLSGGANGFQLDTPTFSIDAANNRVGIGTTNPVYTLDVYGQTVIRGNLSGGYDGSTEGGVLLAKTSSYGSPSVQGVTSGFAVTTLALNPAGGNVGVGLTNPTTKFAVSGLTSSQTGRTVCADASGNFYYFAGSCVASSIKNKENITDLFDVSENIFQLRPVRYAYKDSGEQDIGLIAEEVATILPDLVYYNNGAISGVKYDKLPLFLLQAAKNQKIVLDTHTQQLTEQQQHINNLEQQIDTLSKQFSELKHTE